MAFNTVDYRIWGILPFHFWVIVGATISLSVGLCLYHHKGVNVKSALCILLLCVPGLLIGAAIFGAVSNAIKESLLLGYFDYHSLFRGGIVFYGGLTGFIISYLLLWRNSSRAVRLIVFDIISIVIALFHSFARIGCFTAGCCYGKECSLPICVLYTNIIDGEIVTMNRIPTQLIESLFEFLLFCILLGLFKKDKMKGKLLWVYLIVYSSFRFIIEYFRGDWNRSAFSVFSFSQIISIVIFVLSVIVILTLRNKERRFL